MIKDIIDAAIACKIAGILTTSEYMRIFEVTCEARERLAKEKKT